LTSNPPPRVLVLSEIPTPYRLPLYARLAALPEIELDLVFCSADEPDRPWDLSSALDAIPHRVLSGVSIPVRTRRNTFVYEVNPAILGLLTRTRYDVVVVGGYAVFAEQVAIAVSRARRIPYLLHSESTLLNQRAAWLRAGKRALLRPVIAGAAAGLAVGSEAARYLEHYGLAASRIRIVPNTIDVAVYGRAADAARLRADDLRRELDLPPEFALFAGRLVGVKGIEDLLAALELLGDNAPLLVVAGEGPLESDVAVAPNVRRLGFVQQAQLIELFALATWTVVPSRFEPWGVVVNEALACGCPVIATDAVGAAHDLVVNGVNGWVVPPHDPRALAARLAGPRLTGDASRGRIQHWTYDFAVSQFLEAIQLALHGS